MILLKEHETSRLPPAESTVVFSSLAEITAAAKDGNVVPVQQCKQQEYLVRLGSLSSRLRQRAYLHAVAKIRRARQRIHESLSQLQQIIHMV